MRKRFKVVDDGFSAPPPIVPANNIVIQVANNGYIVHITDMEGNETLEVFTPEDIVEMLQAITEPLGFQLSSERANQ
jgi:hypothetical protein